MKVINENLPEEDIKVLDAFFDSSKVIRENVDDEVLFIRLPDESVKNRMKLRKSVNMHTGTHIVVCSSDDKVARLAWLVNAFYFLKYPITKNQLNSLLHKITSNGRYRDDANKLKMTYKGGFKMISPENICVIRGKGDYCKFYIKNEKSQLYTARISDVHDKIAHIPYLKRINQSLIINVNQLNKVDSDQVYFKSKPNDIQIRLNKKVIKSIKKELLWLN